MEYSPHLWVAIQVDESYKVFAVWMGGYLGADEWRINSGIESVDSKGSYFLIKGCSGSVYTCNKKSYNLNGYGHSVLYGMIARAKMKGVEIKVLDFEEFNLKYT